MKKIFITLALCIAIAGCAPLRVVLNTTYKGDRVVLTSEIPLFSQDGGTFYAALGAKVSQKDTILAVLVKYDGDTNKGIFDKDDRMRFRLNDGTEFAICNLYDKEYESSVETNTTEVMKTDDVLMYTYSPWMDAVYLNPVRVSRWVPQVYTTTITNSYGLYPISKAEFESILKQGVAKLRIESQIGDADMPKPEELSNILGNQRQCLRKALKEKKDTSF